MSWRWDCKWEGGENVCPHAGENTEVRVQDGAQLNRAANLRQDPLLLWWFFGGPLLCTNSENRAERNREGRLSQAEGKQWAQRTELLFCFKHWEASDSKCALFKKELEVSGFHPLQEVNASHYITQIPRHFLLYTLENKMTENYPNSKTKATVLSLKREFHIKTSKREWCDAPAHLLQPEVKTKVLMHMLTTESWKKQKFGDISAFAYRAWVLYWYPCQRRSAHDLATLVQAPSGLLKTMSACGGEESLTPVAGTGLGAHFGHCCGWSFGRGGDCPGYRWRGTLARHRSLRHLSPQDQAEKSDERNLLWKRWKGQR